MFNTSGIFVIHIHELKKLWPSNHPLCGHFRWYKYLNCRPWRTEYIFVTALHNKRRATASRDNLWTRNRCQQPRTSTRNDAIPSVDASKVYFVASLLTQYWLACKLTCKKRNFDTHQSVTDITAAIGTPWLRKLGLGLTTGRSSITTFVLTSVDWWLCLWPSAKFQPNFGFKMKLSCRGHDHALPFAYDLFRVTYLIWNQACTCVHMHTEDRKHLWLFIVAALRWFSKHHHLHSQCSRQNYAVPWTITVENVDISSHVYSCNCM